MKIYLTQNGDIRADDVNVNQMPHDFLFQIEEENLLIRPKGGQFVPCVDDRGDYLKFSSHVIGIMLSHINNRPTC